MENKELKNLSAKELMSKYKRILRNAPNVMFASNEELDKYYDEVFDLEKEIVRRMEVSDASK